MPLGKYASTEQTCGAVCATILRQTFAVILKVPNLSFVDCRVKKKVVEANHSLNFSLKVVIISWAIPSGVSLEVSIL